jgi:hypothetical protein
LVGELALVVLQRRHYGEVASQKPMVCRHRYDVVVEQCEVLVASHNNGEDNSSKDGKRLQADQHTRDMSRNNPPM